MARATWIPSSACYIQIEYTYQYMFCERHICWIWMTVLFGKFIKIKAPFPFFSCLDNLGQASWSPYVSGQSLDLGPIISLRVSVFSPSGASGQELWSGQKVAEPRVKPGRRRGKKSLTEQYWYIAARITLITWHSQLYMKKSFTWISYFEMEKTHIFSNTTTTIWHSMFHMQFTQM